MTYEYDFETFQTNLRAALDRSDFYEAERLLLEADRFESWRSSEIKVLRARNALLRGQVQLAFDVLSAAADIFGSIDLKAPSQKRLVYAKMLKEHGQCYERFGSNGLALAEQMVQDAMRQTNADATKPNREETT